MKDCTRAPYRCHIPTHLAVLFSILDAAISVYFVGTAIYMRRTFNYLRTEPYSRMRIAHVNLRLKVGGIV